MYKTFKKFFVLILALWGISTFLSFLVPADPETLERYNISEFHINLVRIGFALPTLLLWSMVLLTTVSFWKYAQKIKDSPDGKGFIVMAWGILLVLCSLIVSSYFSSIGALIKARSADPDAFATFLKIVRNYVSLAFTLAIYGCYFVGSRKLLATVSKKFLQKSHIAGMVIFLVVVLIYGVLVFQNPYRTTSDNPLITPTYELSDRLIALTIVLPTAISWFLGIMAMATLQTFYQQTQGLVYKDVFHAFYLGISVIIGTTIALGWLAQFAGFLSHLGFSALIWIIIALYVLLIWGYWWAAQGARRLNKIESL